MSAQSRKLFHSFYARKGGHINNNALSLFRHDLKSCVTTQKGAAQIDSNYAIPRDYIHFNKWAYYNYSRTVDQDINAPIGLHGLLKEGMNVFFTGNVTYNGKYVTACTSNLSSRFIEMRRSTAEKDDPCSLPCEKTSCSPSNASSRSGNNSNAIFDTHTWQYSRSGVT